MGAFVSFWQKEWRDGAERFRWAIVSTIAFYLAAHGYRLSHAAFAGDGLLMIYKDDAAWEVALGRIVHPLLVLLRGGLETPFLIGLLAAWWIGLSVWLMTGFLEIRRRLGVVSTSGVCVCNVILTTTNGAYLFISDYYMLALCLAVGAAILVWQGAAGQVQTGIRLRRLLLAAVCIALSVGIYQAYICVTLALLLLKWLFTAMEAPEKVALPGGRVRLRQILFMAVPFLLGGGVYYGIWKAAQRVLHIWTADGYNGMASLGDYGGTSVPALLTETLRRFAVFFVQPEVFVTYSYHGQSLSIVWLWLLRICHLAAVASLCAYVVLGGRKGDKRIRRQLVAVVCLVLFPFACNLILLLTKGMEHSLMLYAFILLYVAAIRGLEGLKVRWVSGFLLIPVLWSQIIYANQFYLKLDLYDHAAASMLTRIAVTAEQMPRYKPGQTPVAFAGIFESSPHLARLSFYDEINPLGVGKSLMPYGGTPEHYLTQVLNVPMCFTDVDAEDPAVAAMPCFPEQGSVAWVGDTLVVKLSE
ncbi:MAG: glucosyltransferase domain-containing protein [Butyrivibrio sp.]|nr:glucosyltransferase domain-containing protein [Butyrivibrio sp.]